MDSFRNAIELGALMTEGMGRESRREYGECLLEQRSAGILLNRHKRRARIAARNQAANKNKTSTATLQPRRAIVVDDMAAVDSSMFDSDDDGAVRCLLFDFQLFHFSLCNVAFLRF